MNSITPNDLAARPGDNTPEMWVQEAIFGHRFIEEQKPYMLVLEVLSVCGAVLQKGDRLFSHGPVNTTRDESLAISIAKRGPLRYLLFEDISLENLKQNENLTDDDKLDRLIEDLNKGYRARTNRDNAFNYLRERFEGRFPALAQAVDILRSMEIDTITSRRWTSRFLAPRGEHLFFSDIGNKLSSDRRFFGRGGELMYLMLSRAKIDSPLHDIVKKEFFSIDDPMDKLIVEIDPGDEERTGDAPLGYLPLLHHKSYDRLASDWVSILGLTGLPSPQKFEPLFRLSALNLVRYFMERASEVSQLRDSNDNLVVEPIILDVSGGSLGDMRRRSISHLKRVRETIDEAVESYVRNKLDAEVKWQRARAHHDPEMQFNMAVQAIENAFKTDLLSRENLSRRKPDACLSFFLKKATSRSRNNISTLIEPLGKHSGFITARKGAGTWFDASDEFLEALVIGTIQNQSVTVESFLSRIYERYGIIIGPNEAAKAFTKRAFDPFPFEENMKIFERRLMGLGYVKRLSDDCAFMANPYAS